MKRHLKTIFLLFILLASVISCTDGTEDDTTSLILQNPTITPTDDTVNSGDKITILPPSNANDAVIFYSTDADASEITDFTDTYYDPIVVPDDVTSFTVKAVAVKSGFTQSDIVSRTYTVESTTTAAKLTALSLSSGTLSPVFSANTYSYTASVSNSVASVTVTAKAASGSTITVNGSSQSTAVALTAGATTDIAVVVTNDSSSTTYTVSVYRSSAELSSDSYLSSLTISSGTLSFVKTTTDYAVSVAYATTSVTITYATEDSAATAVASSSSPLSLSVGTNTYTITVTAEDGSSTVYTITITRAEAITPVVTASPTSKSFTDSVTVTLTVTPSTTIYYTTDGTTPSASSTVYSSALTFTSTTTLKTCVIFDSGSNVQTFTYTKTSSSSYYSTNPDGQVGVYNANMSVSCTNCKSDSFADWSDDMLIAQGVAYDDAKSFKGNHEYPSYDTYSLYAAWDDTYLYLGWQFVYVNDIMGNSGGTEAKPYNGDIPQMLVFDIDPTKSSVGGQSDGNDIWASGTFKRFDLSMGVDTIAMFSSKGGVGSPSVFYMNDSTGYFEYATSTDTTYAKGFSALGIVYGAVDGLLPSTVYGIQKDDYAVSDLSGTTGWVDFVTLGHLESLDTFYEMKIPLSALGITRSYLESTGIGVMHISTFGESGIASIPFDGATLDNATEDYSKDSSTSYEKEDLDNFSVSLARIGHE